MNFASCPKCGVGQKLKNLITLTNSNAKLCHSCDVEYVLEKSKSTAILIALILPILIIYYLQPFSGIFNLVAFFVWFAFGVVFYVFKTPLKVKST